MTHLPARLVRRVQVRFFKAVVDTERVLDVVLIKLVIGKRRRGLVFVRCWPIVYTISSYH